MKQLFVLIFIGLFYVQPSTAKDNITFIACDFYSVFLPDYYNEYLNDDNQYFAIGKKKLAYDWDWKKGEFGKKINIVINTEEQIMASTGNFDDINDNSEKFSILLNKYSLKLYIRKGYIKKKLFSKDEVKVSTTELQCIKIDRKKLGKLKPRIN